MRKNVEIVRPFFGLVSMQVCCKKGTSDEEILQVCNEDNPAGTSNGWCEVVRDSKSEPARNPVQCEEAEDREHIIVDC